MLDIAPALTWWVDEARDAARKKDDRKHLDVRLPNNERGQRVLHIANTHWKGRKPTKVMNAIELYEALERGDTTLLSKFFPGLFDEAREER